MDGPIQCPEMILNKSKNTFNKTYIGSKSLHQGFQFFFFKILDPGIYHLGSSAMLIQLRSYWLYYLAGRFNALTDRILRKKFEISEHTL